MIISGAFHFFIFNKTNMNVIDEMHYMFGILDGVKASAYPSPLFFLLNKYIKFSQNIVENSRFINLIFYLIGLFPIYQITKKYLNFEHKILFSIFYLFSPFSFYITNVMPEIIFGTLFYFYVFFLDAKDFKASFASLFFSVFFILCMTYLKNYGIFLIPIYVFIALISSGLNVINKILHILLFLFIFFGIKYLIDTNLYGNFFLLGKIYGETFKSSSVINLKTMGINLFGNLLFFTPFLILFFFVKNKVSLLNSSILKNRFNLFVMGCLILFVFVTTAHNNIVSNLPGESAFRINERYYSFLIILFLISITTVFEKIKFKSTPYTFFAFALFLLISILNKYVFFKVYDLSYIDNPDLFAFYQSNLFFIPTIIVITYLFYARFSLLMGFFLLITSFLSCFNMSQFYISRKIDTPPDFAGKYLCQSSYKGKIDKVFTDNIVSFGFFYYNCPAKYKVYYPEDFNLRLTDKTLYVGNYVYNNRSKFNSIDKISDSFFIKN